MLEEKYCTNVRRKILYQCQNKNIVPMLEEKYCTNVSFLCCPIMCLYVLSFVLWCPLQFPHFGSYSPPVVCRKAHVLFTLYVIVCVQCCPTHIVLCFCFGFYSSCVPYVACFSVFFFVLCTICCQFLCVFLRLVYPMLPVSLCFSSSCVPYVASFSGLSFFDCPFGIL